MFLRLSTPVLMVVLLALMLGAAIIGQRLGHLRREDERGLRESSGVLQGALLGFMGLILAFGLSLALGRYDARRAALVDDANTIGTTWLRSQTLAEPYRSQSMPLLIEYTDVELQVSHVAPGTDAQKQLVADGAALHEQLWAILGKAVAADPTGTAPRMYMDTLNDMIDQQTTRISGLNNRVPTEVLLLQVSGSAMAMFLLGLHVGVLDRHRAPLLVTAALVTMLLFVTFDLDRPTEGFILIPDTPLSLLRESMDQPPAAGAPSG